ncbi:MAG: YraN family protein [Coriobacteriia bacterium]
MTEKSQRLGERGEEAAAAYLERIGITVVERNWRCQHGEIDIVGLDGETVVLCEVKTRRTRAKGNPEESITSAKRLRYSRLAQAYLQESGLTEVPVRFDVIGLLVIAEDRALLRHHRAAFVVE